MKFKLFTLNPKKIRLRAMLLFLPSFLFIFLYFSFYLLKSVTTDLSEMKLVKGRIYDSFPYTIKGSKAGSQKNLMVCIDDTIFIKFPDGQVFERHWPMLKADSNLGRAIKVYVLKDEIDSYLSIGNETIYYYKYPYQVELEKLSSSETELTLKEKRIMIENGDSSFLYQELPYDHSARWEVIIPRSELDFSRTIGGILFLGLAILVALLLLSAVLSYYEKLYALDKRILRRNKKYILWMWFREAG